MTSISSVRSVASTLPGIVVPTLINRVFVDGDEVANSRGQRPGRAMVHGSGRQDRAAIRPTWRVG